MTCDLCGAGAVQPPGRWPAELFDTDTSTISGAVASAARAVRVGYPHASTNTPEIAPAEAPTPHGDRKSFALKYEKLLGVEMYADGVRLTADTGKARLIQITRKDNLEIVGAVLSQLVNRT